MSSNTDLYTPKGDEQMKIDAIIDLVLKAVALAMGIASIVIGLIPGVVDASTQMTLLSIGLAALAIAALQQEKQSGGNTL
jgi:hypothetical protein